MKFKDASFTVFDVETTGLYPYSGDRICEIGAIRTFPHSAAKRFHFLIDPGRPVSAGAFAVNGITAEMLAGKPVISEVLPDFMKFIKGSVLVAYNAGFDIGFLEAALGDRKNELAGYRILDALSLARELFPGMGRYNLGAVAERLGIEVSAGHRALSDAMMTLSIFERELAELRKRGIVKVEEMERVTPRRKVKACIVRDYRMKLIEEAISEQKRLNIVYRSSWNNAVTRRAVTPKRVEASYDRSYLVAHCHLRDEERIFRVDCIIDVDEGK